LKGAFSVISPLGLCAKWAVRMFCSRFFLNFFV